MNANTQNPSCNEGSGRRSGWEQGDLFAHVAAAYADADSGTLTNAQLYRAVAQRAGISESEAKKKLPIGRAASMRSPIERKIRWAQQSLKQMKVLERVDGERGLWRLAVPQGKGLDAPAAGASVLAFSTDLGIAIWGNSPDTWVGFSEPVALLISSPPYLLRQPRAYGNPADESAYVDFICRAIEPIVRQLMPGGSVVLNVGNDIFIPGMPARSMYLERLTLALHDRLGLWLMDRIPWVDYSKPPGPTYWACVNRFQLSAAYEPVLWFTNDPQRVRADNRRVLEPHTQKHLRLMGEGGEHRTAVYGDGAYRLRPGSFGSVTAGRIPRNVITQGHRCPDTIAYRRYAQKLGLPVHGAMQPTAIADFFIRFLTEPGDLIVDAFGGTLRSALAAERLGRRWFVVERILQYLRGAAGLFEGAAGFQMGHAFEGAFA